MPSSKRQREEPATLEPELRKSKRSAPKVIHNISEESQSKKSKKIDDLVVVTNEDEFGVEKMTVALIKEQLEERECSTKGDKKTLVKRLIERLTKEKDPNYKPKAKGRFCKWCGDIMKKKRGVKGEFFGCTAYPTCQYTTSLSGYAKPSREVLRGQEAIPQQLGRIGWAMKRQNQEDRAERSRDKAYD